MVNWLACVWLASFHLEVTPRRPNLHCSALFPLYSRVWSVFGGEQSRQKVVKKREGGGTGGPNGAIVPERICEKRTLTNSEALDLSSFSPPILDATPSTRLRTIERFTGREMTVR